MRQLLKRKSMVFIYAAVLQLLYSSKIKAQFINGDKDVKTRTIAIADSLLKNQLVKVSPGTVSEYLRNANKAVFVKVIKLPMAGKNQIDAETIYSQSKNAVGWVAMCYRKHFTGPLDVNAASAFVITQSGICLTNYHVLYAFANDKGLDGSGAFMIRLGNGKIYQLKDIIAASKEDDIAILQLDIKPDEELPYISIEKNLPKIGEDLFMLGNPQDMYYSFTKGIVSNLYTDAIAWPDGSGGSFRDLMAITADFAVGASGSPIINKKGNVIGMVSATHTIEQNKGGYPLTQMVIKNAIPNLSLIKLLGLVNVK